MDQTCKFSHFIDVSYGAVYPALSKLEEEGLINGQVQHQDGKPSKKVYAITPDGRDELVRNISQQPEQDKFKSEFLLVAMHANILPKTLIKQALDRRIAFLQQKIAAMENCCNKGGVEKGSDWVFRYGLMMNQTSLDYMLKHRIELENMAKANDGTNTDTTLRQNPNQAAE